MVFDGTINGSARKSMQGMHETPHWMKVLEERYQRLHAKVVNGAARFIANRIASDLSKPQTERCLKAHKSTSKRSSVITEQGCNGYDFNENPPIGAAYNEPEHSDTTCIHPTAVDSMKELVKFNRTHHSQVLYLWEQRGPSQDNYSVTRKNISENGVTGPNKDTSQTCVDGICAPTDVINCKFPSENAVSPDSYSENSFYVRQNTAGTELSRGSLFRENSDAAYVDEPNGDTRLEGNILHSNNTSSELIQTYKGADSDGDDSVSPAAVDHMKTITNKRRRKMQNGTKTRTNRKVNKSLPLKVFEENIMLNPKHTNDSRNSTLKRTAERGDHMIKARRPLMAKEMRENRMRVFSQMSFEARIAVKETLNEMKRMEETEHGITSSSNIARVSTDPGHVEDNSNDSTANSTNDHGFNSFIDNNRLEESTVSNLADSEVSTATQIPSSCNTVKKLLYSSSSNKVSTNNQRTKSQDGGAVKSIKVTKVTSQRLPEIHHHNVAHNLPSAHARLPGIGNAKTPLSFRESTFEITPLNFDIRFHQIIPCQNENREDPSADILQQSIQKCNQWLIRYIVKQ